MQFKKIVLGIGMGMLSSLSLANQSDEGNPLTSTVWNSNNIPVCWESFTDSTSVQRGWIESVIANTWESVSDVDFTGWGQCSSGSTGVRIQVQDVGPAVSFLGNALNGVTNGMRLNFTFNNWSASACQSNVKFCAEVTAVHEFGHALGFAHEQNRPDTPSSCTDSPQGTNGDLLFGAWDLQSVMNYCNPSWNGNGDLSDTDIDMVQRFYSNNVPNFDYVQMQNYWQRGKYIHLETGAPQASTAQNGWWSAQWSLEQAGDYYRIKNRWKSNSYLHIQNGPIESGSAPSGWWSAQWKITKVANSSVDDQLKGIVYTIQNRWKPEIFLHVENGVLEAGEAETNWWSARWILNGINQ